MEIDRATGLLLIDRRIEEAALHRLFQNEQCTMVQLSEFRLDKAIKQAVGLVIFGRGRSRPSCSGGGERDSGALYFVTDLRGNTATMELFQDAKQKFRGVSSIGELEGTVLYLISPKVMSDPQRPDTLLFQMTRQQDMVVVGKCPTFGKCDGTRRDGKDCTMPVDTSEATRCKYHKERVDSNLSNISTTVVKPKPVPPAAAPQRREPETATQAPPKSNKDIDILQQALKPVVRTAGSSNQILHKKSSAICPQDENDDDDEFEQGAVPVSNRSSLGGTVRNHPTVGTSSVIEGERKDGSVAVPKESRVFKVLAESFYTNLEKQNAARATAIELQRTSSMSSAPALPGTSSSNGLLGNRHNGASRYHELVAQNNKRKLDQSVQEKINNFSKLKCIGGDLVDLDKARLNANRTSMKQKAVELKSVEASKKKQLDLDIEALLNMESSHREEAEDDAFKQQMGRLDNLAKREYMVQKDEKVQSLKVRAYQCVTCSATSESPLDKCRRSGHVVNIVSVVKRFYECTKCENRESTLGGSVRLPKHACLRCNEYKWRVCGKRKTGFETSSRVSASDKLVVSMSEDTRRYDVDRVAGAKSALDYIK